MKANFNQKILQRDILVLTEDQKMEKEKGISKLVLVVIIALIIVAAIYWARYFAKPMATVMMGGAEQAQPAIEKAKQASDAVSRANKVNEEAAKKVSEDTQK
jgi:flagellar basal body-associated protein FliL